MREKLVIYRGKQVEICEAVRRELSFRMLVPMPQDSRLSDHELLQIICSDFDLDWNNRYVGSEFYGRLKPSETKTLIKIARNYQCMRQE